MFAAGSTIGLLTRMGLMNGTLGNHTGQVGNTVARNWKGLAVIALMPSTYNDANTVVQQGNRSTFKAAVEMGRQALNAIRVGLNQYQNGTTPWAQWVKLNKEKYQMVNGLPVLQSPLDVTFSRGTLDQLGVTNAVAAGANGVTVTWSNVNGGASGKPTDLVSVVIVDAAGEQAREFIGVAVRSAGTVTVQGGMGIVPAGGTAYAFAIDDMTGDTSNSEASTI